jgi:putative transposase
VASGAKRISKKNRINEGRNATPSYGIIDSQSTKTLYASESCGIDGGKKVKGRKRHIVTDTMGNLLTIKVHAANIHDTIAGIEPARKAFMFYPTIKAFCGDDGYRGTFVDNVWEYMELRVDIVSRISPGFVILPKRWVVERTFAWASHSRRLSKDYEISIDSAEAMFMISHIHTLLKRLA